MRALLSQGHFTQNTHAHTHTLSLTQTHADLCDTAAQDAAALVRALIAQGHITRAARTVRDLMQYLRPPLHAVSADLGGRGGVGADLSGLSASRGARNSTSVGAGSSHTLSGRGGVINSSRSDESSGSAAVLWRALPLEVLRAAAHKDGSGLLLASVYRCFAASLSPVYSNYEAAAAALLVVQQ